MRTWAWGVNVRKRENLKCPMGRTEMRWQVITDSDRGLLLCRAVGTPSETWCRLDYRVPV